MYEFTPREREPETQPSGRRLGPPRKYTAADLLDPLQFPPIRVRCFGCSQPFAIVEIGRHVRGCYGVSAPDLARFQAALAEFKLNPSRAQEVLEVLLSRIRL